jgi:hypothetical protein
MEYVTVNTIISQCYSDLGKDATDENHKRYFAWVLRGYKQLRLFALPLDKAVTLPVQTNIRCVILPKDYVDFVAIGRDYNNKFTRFNLKDNIMPNTTTSCGTETQTDTFPTSEYGWSYANGGGRNDWYYRLDEANNRILIEGDTLTEATLVYKSTGVDINGETFIPKIAEEALIAWVHWQEALNDKSISSGMAQIRKVVFDGAVNDIHMAQLDLDSLMDAVYSTIYQGIKR